MANRSQETFIKSDSMAGRRNVFAMLVVVSITATEAKADAADAVTVKLRETWSNVFGDSEVTFHFTVTADKPIDGRLGWSLSAGHRTISRGEFALQVGPKQPVTVATPLKIPPVDDGVVFKVDLAASVFAKDTDKPLAVHRKPIWVFSRNPFADRAKWLAGLKITLYDPQGKTADVFEKAEIPFHQTRSVAGLEDLRGGLLIVGEGTSFADHRDVAETIINVAASGVPVFCMAPVDGSLPMPGSDGAEKQAVRRVLLTRAEAVKRLDKRLDAEIWPPGVPAVVSRFSIKSLDDRVVAEVTKKAHGWPWIEADYGNEKGKPKGKLVVCGWGIMEHWDSGPVPRFLFARVLETLSQTDRGPSGRRRDGSQMQQNQ